jgi:hypothetical protein
LRRTADPSRSAAAPAGPPDFTPDRAGRVGSGAGDDHAGTPPRIAGSLKLSAHTFGVSEIALSPGGWSQRFVGEPGSTFSDAGSAPATDPARPPHGVRLVRRAE